VSRFIGTTGDGVFNQLKDLPNPKCRALLEHDGTSWVGTWGGGVGTYDIAGDTWSKLDSDSGLVNDMVGDIDADGQEIFFATNNGASIYVNNDQLPMNQRWTEYRRLKTDIVSTVTVAQTPTRGREVWYGPRWEEMILEGDEDLHGITVVRAGLSQPIYYTMLNSGLLEPNVNEVYYDEAADLFWVGFSTKGLASVDVDGSTWTYYNSTDGLPSDVVFSVTKVDTVIWVGTQAGVARMKPDGTFQGYDRAGGLPADRVRKVYSDDPARLWAGLIDGGAILLNPNSAQ
jgi:ligand-binding sensor domain-containing protein